MASSAFSLEYNAKLALGKYTRWAVDLPEDTLQALLWMVGEFGLRAERFVKPPLEEIPDIHIHSDSVINARTREALRTIAAIVHGERIDVEEVRRRIMNALNRLQGS